MSNYRRLISYIYAYEGETKGKNIGFAKIEARNGQCKISVSVKKVYVGNNDMGVYLLTEGMEIFLGKVFIRGGAGEFRTSVSVTDVEKTGKTMDQCYGLTIHSVEDSWRSYTTIWEDAAARTAIGSQENEEQGEPIAHAAQLEPGEQTQVDVTPQAAVVSLEEAAEALKQENDPIPDTVIQERKEEDRFLHHKSSIVEEIEAEIQAQEQSVELKQEEASSLSETETAQDVMMSNIDPVSDSELLKRLEQEEQEEHQPDRLWQHFRKQYPKIQAFDYAGGCEILTIKPQDIGLLPRETWTYGNNSFLLHGYYNYRYLILVKLNMPQGGQRYLLGVPGHYYSNEKYMAGMFGFPHFVLSKMQPAGDGRFGYWYADISLGNQ